MFHSNLSARGALAGAAALMAISVAAGVPGVAAAQPDGAYGPDSRYQDCEQHKTGATVAVPAKRVPFFKPSKELRDLVNPSEAGHRGQKSERGSSASGNGASGDGSNSSVDPHHPPAM